jgi:hypothetical protein
MDKETRKTSIRNAAARLCAEDLSKLTEFIDTYVCSIVDSQGKDLRYDMGDILDSASRHLDVFNANAPTD